MDASGLGIHCYLGISLLDRPPASIYTFVGNLWEAELSEDPVARTVRNQKLDTRSARAKLPFKKAGYWVSIAKGCAIGYRKGPKGGVWLCKLVRPDFRREATLGPADDVLDADGVTALDFAEAQQRARAWLVAVAREADGGVSHGPYTVANAMADYLAYYGARGGKAMSDTEARIAAFITPTLGDVPVSKLTAKRIRNWHAELAASPVRLRTRKGAEKRNFRKTKADDFEGLRRRRATANRTLTILKAALNHAFRDQHVPNDEAWRRVAPFREADASKVRYLDAAETTRLVNATDKEFRPLVQAALLTGCRYGELAALRVTDFDATAETVTVRAAKAGKPRHVVLTEDGTALFSTHTAGKTGDAVIFPRHDGHAWGKSHQHRRLRKACQHAAISPAVSFHILRHTYATMLLRGGAPLAVIAQNLGHADTRMTERHYAHLIPGYVASTIRAALPRLGIVEPPGNVVLIQKGHTS
jgi:integrase